MQSDWALCGVRSEYNSRWGNGLYVGVSESFNSSKQTTWKGQHVQQGLVSSNIANSHLYPMSQLHTYTHTVANPVAWLVQAVPHLRKCVINYNAFLLWIFCTEVQQRPEHRAQEFQMQRDPMVSSKKILLVTRDAIDIREEHSTLWMKKNNWL